MSKTCYLILVCLGCLWAWFIPDFCNTAYDYFKKKFGGEFKL